MPEARSQAPHELLSEHRSLGETLRDIEALAAAAPSIGAATAWLQSLGARLETLAPRLRQHFAHEERSGLFADVAAATPAAAGASGHLLEEHRELLARVQALRDEAHRPISAVSSLQALAERTRSLLGDLARHEERENDLLLDAVEGETAAQD